MAQTNFTPSELYDAGPVLSRSERVEGSEFLQRDDAESFFLQLNTRERTDRLLGVPVSEQTLVDVTGLVIYFTVAAVVLRGTLL